MRRKLILLLLCSLQTESCWPCSGTVIAQGCIILLSLSMISPFSWVIITKTGIKSFKPGPTFLAGNWAKEFPARYKGRRKSPSHLSWFTTKSRAQGGWGISVLGGIQNLTGQGSEQLYHCFSLWSWSEQELDQKSAEPQSLYGWVLLLSDRNTIDQYEKHTQQ